MTAKMIEQLRDNSDGVTILDVSDTKDIWDNNIRPYLKGCEVFEISPIAYFCHILSDTRNWELGTDIPNIAPPFESFWMEYEMPEFSFAFTPDGEKTAADNQLRKEHERIGIYFHVDEEYERPDDIGEFDPWVRWRVSAYTIQSPEGFRGWLVQHPDPLMPIVEMLDAPMYFGVRHTFYIDNSGNCNPELMESAVIEYPTELNEIHTKDYITSASLWNLLPAFMALSFLHARDTRVIDTADEQEAQARAKKKGKRIRHPKPRPRYHYKRLLIKSIQTAYENRHQFSRTNRPPRLHQVRGQFRTYTQEAPLFGHFVGTVWVEPHLRGRADKGVIEKEYEVQYVEEDDG